MPSAAGVVALMKTLQPSAKRNPPTEKVQLRMSSFQTRGLLYILSRRASHRCVRGTVFTAKLLQAMTFMGVDKKKGGCLHDLGNALKKKYLCNYKQLCRYKNNEMLCFALLGNKAN